MNKIKNVMVSSLLFVTTLCSAKVTSYEDSVYNYVNSPYNYANSQYNYANSPYSYNNSAYNSQAPNAVYNAQGQRTGYKTTTEAGVTNYYDNNGNRKGYSTK